MLLLWAIFDKLIISLYVCTYICILFQVNKTGFHVYLHVILLRPREIILDFLFYTSIKILIYTLEKSEYVYD